MSNRMRPEIQELFTDPQMLIPTIAQDAATGEVLMLAYMNLESMEATLETGRATYWSRSRNQLWEKGLTSGHTQFIKSISLDCDLDAILIKVDQVGAACHTGEVSCFHNEVSPSQGASHGQSSEKSQS